MLTTYSRLQVVLAAALVCAGCAAQSTQDASQTFKSADADGNGTLSPQEVHSLLDADKDGTVSSEEWNKVMVDPADD